MLTEETKNQINAEEIYRNEVRKEIQKNQKKKSTIWSILNSGFTLFFLSSVVIALISWGYTSWEESKAQELLDQKIEKENLRLRIRLQEEAIARIEAYSELRDTIPEYKRINALLAIHGTSIYEDESIEFKYYHQRPLYKSYEGWTMVEILSELSKYVDDQSRNQIIEVKNEILDIRAEDLVGKLEFLKGRNGVIYNSGSLLRPTEKTNRRWIFVTSTNDVFKLGVKKAQNMPNGRHIEQWYTTRIGWRLRLKNGKTIDLPDESIPMVPYYSLTQESKDLAKNMLLLKAQLERDLKMIE